VIPLVAATVLALAADGAPPPLPAWRKQVLSFAEEVEELADELLHSAFDSSRWLECVAEVESFRIDAIRLVDSLENDTAPDDAKAASLSVAKLGDEIVTMKKIFKQNTEIDRLMWASKLYEQARAVGRAARGEAAVWPEEAGSEPGWRPRFERALGGNPHDRSIEPERKIQAAKKAAYDTRILVQMYSERGGFDPNARQRGEEVELAIVKGNETVSSLVISVGSDFDAQQDAWIRVATEARL
jgi:hypothetical protein